MSNDGDVSSCEPRSTKNESNSQEFHKVLHALANKLLPIVAFSDLGVRNAQDPLMLNYFQKIRQAAGDARDILVGLRHDIQERERSLTTKQSK